MSDLTVVQIMTLVDLGTVKKAAAYQLDRPVRVLRSLGSLGFAVCEGGSGQHSVWRITPAGKARLADENARLSTHPENG